MSYEYGSTLYRTVADMTAAVCENFLTAGGTNSDQTVKEYVVETSAESATDEMLDNWGQIDYWTGDWDSDGEKKMAVVPREDVIAAMAESMSGFWNI